MFVPLDTKPYSPNHCAPEGKSVRSKVDGRKGIVSNAGCPVGRGCQVRYEDGELMIYADAGVFERNVSA